MILISKLLAPTLAAALVCLTTFSLGQWQTRRAELREAMSAAADAADRLAPVDVNRLLASTGSIAPEQVLHRHVLLHGEWLPAASVYLDNRQYRERPGIHVLTPLRLPEGRVVVVNRGWQPVNSQGRNRVEAPPVQAGVVEVSGDAVEKLGSYWAIGAEQAGALGGLWPNYSLKNHAGVSGLALEPFVVMQTGEAGDALVRDWPDVGAGSQQNRSYAVQWFSLCALTLVLWCWFTWRAVRTARSAS